MWDICVFGNAASDGVVLIFYDCCGLLFDTLLFGF